MILNPPPPVLEVAVDEKAKKGDKGKGKGKDAGKGKDKGKAKGKGKEAEEVAPVETITSIFVPEIEQAVQEFVAKWQDRDESMNFAQKYDPDLVKDEVRPVVFDEVRRQVDTEMRVLLENLKARTLLLCFGCAFCGSAQVRLAHGKLHTMMTCILSATSTRLAPRTVSGNAAGRGAVSLPVHIAHCACSSEGELQSYRNRGVGHGGGGEGGQDGQEGEEEEKEEGEEGEEGERRTRRRRIPPRTGPSSTSTSRWCPLASCSSAPRCGASPLELCSSELCTVTSGCNSYAAQRSGLCADSVALAHVNTTSRYEIAMLCRCTWRTTSGRRTSSARRSSAQASCPTPPWRKSGRCADLAIKFRHPATCAQIDERARARRVLLVYYAL